MNNFHAFAIVTKSTGLRQKFIDELLVSERVHKIDVMDNSGTPTQIADVRLTQTFLSRKPFASYVKIVLIDGDRITMDAQNAFLKTLEEPPAHSKIYVFVSNPDVLLPTVVSRLHFTYLSPSNIQLTQSSQDGEILSLAFWQNILQKSPGNRLQDASKLIKDRETVLSWIKTQITFLHFELTNSFIKNSRLTLPAPAVLKIIRSLQTAYTQTSANINLKLVFDSLFLNLPAIELYPA